MLGDSAPTGWVSLATATFVLVGNVLAHRDRRRKADAAHDKLDEITVNVNGRLDAALRKIEELEATIAAHPPVVGDAPA